jgi:hypothetical protein
LACVAKTLTAAGREAIDLYARARAKVAAIDKWLEKNRVVTADGQPAACLQIYVTLLNTTARLQAQVLAVIEAQNKTDSALQR